MPASVCIVAYLILWISLRGTDLSLGMALALTADRLELHRLSAFGTRAVGLIRAIPYAEITTCARRIAGSRSAWRSSPTTRRSIVHTSKRGIGAGREFADELRRRIAA